MRFVVVLQNFILLTLICSGAINTYITITIVKLKHNSTWRNTISWNYN